jgi:hypothetical protein
VGSKRAEETAQEQSHTPGDPTGSGDETAETRPPRTGGPERAKNGLEEANVKDLVEDITSVLFIIAAGGLGLWFITVAVR